MRATHRHIGSLLLAIACHATTAHSSPAVPSEAYVPVYTYARDLKPGDISGDGTGEWRGWRNGLKAFWLRDNYYDGAL